VQSKTANVITGRSSHTAQIRSVGSVCEYARISYTEKNTSTRFWYQNDW